MVLLLLYCEHWYKVKYTQRQTSEVAACIHVNILVQRIQRLTEHRNTHIEYR